MSEDQRQELVALERMLLACSHAPSADPRRVCPHLATPKPAHHHLRFTACGVDSALVCPACVDAPVSSFLTVCEPCAAGVEQGYAGAVLGAPEVRVRASPLRFAHDLVTLPALGAASIRAFAPLPGAPRSRWLAVVGDDLLGLDLDGREALCVASLRDALLDLAAPIEIHASPCGRFAAIVNTSGRRGYVVDLASGSVTLSLDRGGYHEDVCRFSVAFFRRGERTLLAHATAWNRLDISDPATGQLLTPRDTACREGGERPPHYLDYFHCGLTVSPDGAFIADGGWVWHPEGVVAAWDLRRWLDDHPYESEDGPSRRVLTWREPWDTGMCFVDARTLALWGFGEDARLPAVQLFDVESGRRLSWFADVPDGTFRFDRWLYVTSPDAGTSVWDVAAGERIAEDRNLTTAVHHEDAHELVTPLGEGRFRRSRLGAA